MENTNPSKKQKFPTFAWLYRSAFSWRVWRRVLLGVGILVTLIALFYAEEDFRGKGAWENYKRQLVSRGVELNWHALAPRPVPAGQNFAMTPFLAPLLDLNPEPLAPGQSRWRDTNGYERAGNFSSLPFDNKKRNSIKIGNWTHGQLLDLQALTTALRDATNAPAPGKVYATRAEAGEALLRGLQPCEPVLEELREASRRPYARFNVNYGQEDIWGILLPHLSVVKGISVILWYRASAELAVGKPDAAFEDVKLLFYLADSIRDEPMLISQLVRNAILNSAQNIIWEGLAQHRWTDRQLQDFQAKLQSIAPLKELQKGLASERAAGNTTFDIIRKNPRYVDAFIGNINLTSDLFRIIPSGWIYREQISYNRFFDKEFLTGVDWEAGKVEPRAMENTKWVDELGTNELTLVRQHMLFSKLLLPALTSQAEKFSYSQAQTDEAEVACALERYRLAKGQFPETLDALVPKFIQTIPHDVIGGGPLKYRRTDDGQFVLYSIGWNESDDGGKFAMGIGSTAGVNIDQGDWLWPPYPPK